MNEAIFLAIGVALGYTLCWLSMKESVRSLTLTIEMLQGAFNARFGVRTPVTHTKPETAATEPPTEHIVTDEKDIPKKAQFDLKPVDLRSLRAEAANKKDAADRELRRQMGLIEDHL